MPNLERGRSAYREGAWQKAFDLLSAADREQALSADDLERLARAAYMLGRDDDYVASLERAIPSLVDAGDVPRAVRCAFWIGHSFLFRGEKTRGAGWFARAQRMLDGVAEDCVEHGYLRIPLWLEQMARGDFESGYATSLAAAKIAERFGDADLVWLARDEQARALLGLGRVREGLRLVDETLIAASAGELSAIVTGIVYCNTIAFCRAHYELRHVRDWVGALTSWCEGQPEMIAHNGLCLVHRAEIMLLRGDWESALEEARRSAERFSLGTLNRLACGEAFYVQGEVHRLRGDFAAAEEAYRQASERGREPQPGLALMRLRQDKRDAAVAAIRRVIGERTLPMPRAAVLPAYVEIMLAAGNLDLARAGYRELDEIRVRIQCETLEAMTAHVRGAVALADGRAEDALGDLRRAADVWLELGAPYEAARVRVRLGQACRALADEDTAKLELLTARKTFDELGAQPDRAAMESSIEGTKTEETSSADNTHGLTTRELQVLRCLAGGKTNREIATELFISEHTVARHLQNIFTKISVATRTAAAAFAFEHGLL